MVAATPADRYLEWVTLYQKTMSRLPPVIHRVALLATAASAVAILVGSLLPAQNLPSTGNDKVTHLSAYWMLTAAATVAWLSRRWGPSDRRSPSPSHAANGREPDRHDQPRSGLRRPSGSGWFKTWLGLSLVFTVYGGIIEVVQGFVGRTADVQDALANAIGAGSGAAVVLVCAWIAWKVQPRSPADGQIGG